MENRELLEDRMRVDPATGIVSCGRTYGERSFNNILAFGKPKPRVEMTKRLEVLADDKPVTPDMDGIAAAVCELLLDGTVLHLNSYAEHAYGWREREVVGHQLPPTLNVSVDQLLELAEMNAEGRFNVAVLGVTPHSGPSQPFLFWAALVPSGSGIRLIAISQPLEHAVDWTPFLQSVIPTVRHITNSGKLTSSAPHFSPALETAQLYSFRSDSD